MAGNVTSSFQVTSNQGQNVITNTVTIIGNVVDYFNLPLPTGTTVVSYNQLANSFQSYYILIDQPTTLTVAYVSGGPDVLTIVANQPLFWNNVMQLSRHFTVIASQITSMSFNNTGSVAGTLQMLFIRN